ncbi:SusC/RagA family TonB-linked outer membrane protein [Dyadobacter aurulentus]|uniref:SusC/RagA family TonB-linked outer membrane protein n=1 Tax=Dyadobacter sp. UC 10 TaxID=2605428 RepID=UPI0011F2C017|nr:TonB-dependent receptor [Dyadobacter sp. UC 10]KAA0992709.1 TonB-dependent receptor [Dyadobacter sp. UC 10]
MKTTIYMWFLVICLLLPGFRVAAQGQSVTGKVTGATNEALPGVSILIKGTTQGTTTDETGAYRLQVSTADAVLVFSFVGYVSKEVSVANQSTISVTLQQDDQQLSEVVVVGYGTVRKSDLTGSLSQVKTKEINAFPATNVLQAMSGRAPGVQVTQNTGAPGAAVSVRIRGTNSVQGSNEPLYVVDGFPTSGSNPTIINNSDIESIEILKDASATAIYGSRGANGVVLITTKQGKSGKMQVDYEGSFSQQSLRKKLDLMNATEYANFYNEQAANDKVAPYFTQDQIAGFGNGYDWQDLIFRKAPMKAHNLTVGGGNEKTRFSIGGSILDQDGIVIGSDYKRYSLRASVNSDISKMFALSYGATLTKIKTERRNNAGGNRGGSMISAAISAPPTLTPYNEDGSYRVLATAYPFISNVLINPLNYINEQTDAVDANRVLANAALTFKPFEGLAIKISGGIENSDDVNEAYTTTRFINSQGSASVSNTRNTSLLSENTISYIKTIREKHSISAVAGFTYQNFTNKSLQGSGVGFLSDITETANLEAANTPGIPGSGYSLSSLLSYLGRVNYSFNSKYLATVSFRADGSSKYSEGNKWGFFPSAALAWRLSEENFIKDIAAITDLKLRSSWGRTGSQAINAYATMNNLEGGKTVFDDALYNTFAPGTRLPGNLKWETTEQLDFGLDAAFLSNRYHFSIDYYIKNTRDLLNTVQLPLGYGFTSTIRNVGQIRNKGLEIALDGRIIDKSFKWDLAGNISFNRNKVVKLYNGADILGGSVGVTLISDAANLLREGEPMSVFYGYLKNGYNELGKEIYKDLNADGVINQLDKTIIGNPNPDFIYGINSTMSFKGLELTIFLQGTQGNDLVNVSSINNTLDYGFGLNMPREVYTNHWTPSNPNAKYPVLSRANSYSYSDRLVEDGSYMRLRNIQLAYNFPLGQWGVKWMRSAQLYVSGQNLLTFTKYSWWDPETNSQGGANSLGQGIDHYSYPTSKAVTAGIRVGF